MTRLTPPSAAGAAEAAARFAALAPADVFYTEIDTPVGRLLAARTQRGLARLAYEDVNDGADAVLDDLSVRLSPRILENPARLDDVRRELDEYFEHKRTDFDLAIDFAAVRGDFARRLLRACARIPYGATSSYREMATRAGSPAAVRAAGNALGANPIPIVVPCHRVIGADGSLTGFASGLARKQWLLNHERSHAASALTA